MVAENKDADYPEWQESDIKLAKDYLDNPEKYLDIPSKYNINEYEMMKVYALSLENESQQDKLLDALNGKGAFKRFKDTVYLLDIEKQWYQFKDTEYEKVALDWCEENLFEIVR